jgi:small subunit ribosomal protein S20
MPIKFAAVRQLRKDRKRHQRNQALRAELKTLTRRLARLFKGPQLEEAKTLLRLLTKKLDRAASRGIIHRNTASRTKSRLARRLARSAKPA